jgi:hypothetical protein
LEGGLNFAALGGLQDPAQARLGRIHAEGILAILASQAGWLHGGGLSMEGASRSDEEKQSGGKDEWGQGTGHKTLLMIETTHKNGASGSMLGALQG